MARSARFERATTPSEGSREVNFQCNKLTLIHLNQWVIALSR